MEKRNIITLKRRIAKTIEKELIKFVREHGSDITDREREQFELYDEEGCHITKIFNFYDRDGCNVVGAHYPIKEPDDSENPLNTILDTFAYIGINCIYIERNATGNDSLCYYGWYNYGLWYDADFAESEHGEVRNLGLDELQCILDVVIGYCDN